MFCDVGARNRRVSSISAFPLCAARPRPLAMYVQQHALTWSGSVIVISTSSSYIVIIASPRQYLHLARCWGINGHGSFRLSSLSPDEKWCLLVSCLLSLVCVCYVFALLIYFPAARHGYRPFFSQYITSATCLSVLYLHLWFRLLSLSFSSLRH